jgi:chemotaxis protein methyltransferase CheR
MPISQTDFDYVAQLVRSQAAIVLESGKEYLVENRLLPIAQQEGFGTLEAFIGALRAQTTINGLHHKSIDALTTNETSFFRDFHPFEALRKTILPRLIEQRSATRQLTIWSAACSTGQEPYSLAMLIHEHFPQLRDWKVTIYATDLSPTVLKGAAEGSYSQFEVNRGLPAPLLIRHFVKQGDRWHIKSELKKNIQFRAMNLIQPWPILPPFDLVFIRNVMIYFDVDTKKTILKRIRNCLLPHGYLFLGSTETTYNIDPSYRAVTFDRTVVYQAGGEVGAAAAAPQTAEAISR